MTTYTFELVLTTPTFSDADADRLHQAGADDATVVTRDGITRLVFDRQAPTLEDALRSATADTRAAGHNIARIEMEAPTQQVG